MDAARQPPTELGAFLRTRRGELSPAALGLRTDGTTRHVPGLRRDEVARLAEISLDYYSRIEQGRVKPSRAVLESLTRVLKLDDGQHLHALAEMPPRTNQPLQRPTPSLQASTQRLLSQLNGFPALVLDRCTEILAWNTAAAALYMDFGALPAQARNYTRLLFLSPPMHRLHTYWEAEARLATSVLRADAAAYPDDARCTALVAELSAHSPEFGQWWRAGRTASSSGSSSSVFQHPLVGLLTLRRDTWIGADHPDQRVVMLSAQPATPSEEALRTLTSFGHQIGAPHF
ncbi:helix-turn-helix domain-containing protein [Streptomyces sp. KS_5]|uniref:helix-turn-helix domain-containing protein n=1 Tax=Streptomyces sp. KS_5 TaxID=1881018 RepID=UPI00089A9EC6|nr:helix-turn-helix transcriptional regulator [Streptomyces sp. KS_5]SEE35274.1 Helix-turn-helix domain-containing protein [Streptomyces sp. KS_5]